MEPSVKLAFAHSYEVAILTELTGAQMHKNLLYFPGDVTGRDGIIVKVSPAESSPWVGMFAYGTINRSSGATGIWSTPDRGKFCVMSKGNGYLVNAANPAEWQQVATDAQHVYPVTQKGVLLLSNYYELAAYGADGKLWSFRVTDELLITKIDAETITGTSWEPANDYQIVQFTLNLSDGHRIE